MRRQLKRVVVCFIVALLTCGAAVAEPEARQFTAQSWHGLSGLYVIPTARTIGDGKLALTYSESKHVEWIGSKRFSDRQVRGTVTYGLTDDIEVSYSRARDLLDIGDHFTPQLKHESFNQFSLKWRILEEKNGRPAVAIAVRDVTNDMQDIGVLEKINNGRKYFLLVSKRLVEKEDGRFWDVHAGLTHDELQSISGLFGFEFSISPQMSYIVEGMWDSPYINFRDVYSGPSLTGTPNHEGRFIFDVGLRLYPDIAPGMVIDAGFVGDGSFEFSWGFGYVIAL